MLSLIQFLSIAYLTLPLLIFCASFLLWPLTVIITAIIVFILVRAARQTSFQFNPTWLDLLLLTIAFTWTMLAGIIPILIQSSDWIKHYAILNLLRSQHWPPVLDGEYLRYSIAYYLVPALADKIAPGIIEWAVGLWTVLGVWLAFRLLTQSSNWQRALVFVAVFVFFSGCDLVGTAITGFSRGPVYHLEWWARFGSISSFTTTLFWAPQHGLAAWIGTGLIFAPASHRYGMLIAASLLFWSPFVVIGLLPFAVLAAWQNCRELITIDNILAVVPAFIVAIYLASGSGTIPKSFIWDIPAFSLPRWIAFVLLEWGLLVIALFYYGGDRRLLVIASTTLLCLSLVAFGQNNDLLMRASLPSLTVLALVAAERIWTKPTAPLLIVLALGAPTALGEIARSTTGKRIDLTTVNFGEGRPRIGHYRYQYFAQRPIVIRPNIPSDTP